jgi:DNA polymerase III subunit delta
VPAKKGSGSSPVVLLWGSDPFLLRDAALRRFGETRAREIEGAEWSGSELADLSTPSLFGEQRALLVTDCRDLTKEAWTEIGTYLAAPAPDALLVLTLTVGERSKPPAALTKLFKDRAGVEEVSVARKDLGKWVTARAAEKGHTMKADAAAALVEVVGEQPASLDAAIDQLGNAFPGEPLTKELVHAQFRGLGEQRMWDLCDRAFGKDLAGSIRSLSSLLESREEPLAILGVIASRLRDLLRVKAVPDSAPAAEVARAAGLRFDWQAGRYRDQARRFTMPDLVRIHEEVVEADRVMKSGAPGEVVLSSLVSSVASSAEA